LDQNEKSTGSGLTNILLDFFWKLGMGILLLGFGSVITLWLESAMLFLQPVPLGLTQIFKRMEKLGSHLTGKKTGETPYEYSDRLRSRMNTIRIQKGSGASSVIMGIDLITDSYVLTTFSQNPISRKQVSSVIHSWRRVRLGLMIEIFRSSLGSRKRSAKIKISQPTT
jgi:hypothetical protein